MTTSENWTLLMQVWADTYLRELETTDASVGRHPPQRTGEKMVTLQEEAWMAATTSGIALAGQGSKQLILRGPMESNRAFSVAAVTLLFNDFFVSLNVFLLPHAVHATLLL